MPTGEFMNNVFIGPPGRGLVQPDLTFDVVGLRGSQALSIPMLPEGWWVKDVKLAGRVDFRRPRFRQRPIVLGNRDRRQRASHRADRDGQRPHGISATDYAVVLFPEDDTRWERSRPGQMGARAVRPGLDGPFKLPGLRPGTYYVLAVPVAEADMQILTDPEQLARARGPGAHGRGQGRRDVHADVDTGEPVGASVMRLTPTS